MNPIPAALMFDGTSDTEGFGISTDGGKTFETLGEMLVTKAGLPPRPAGTSDMTYVRWLRRDAGAPSENRSVAFFGLVRLEKRGAAL